MYSLKLVFRQLLVLSLVLEQFLAIHACFVFISVYVGQSANLLEFDVFLWEGRQVLLSGVFVCMIFGFDLVRLNIRESRF